MTGSIKGQASSLDYGPHDPGKRELGRRAQVFESKCLKAYACSLRTIPRQDL